MKMKEKEFTYQRAKKRVKSNAGDAYAPLSYDLRKGMEAIMQMR